MLSLAKIKVASPQLKALVSRRNQLKKTLLNFSSIESDSLPPERQDMLRAFTVFMHAELEYYVEEITRSTIINCKSVWETTRQLNNVLLTMLIYNQNGYSGNDSENIPSSRVDRVIRDATTAIDSNHGVMEKNTWKLLHQIGINFATQYAILSADLESYGKTRGRIVHSSHLSLNRPLIKRVELSKINQIIEQLLELDIEVQSKATPTSHGIAIP